MKKYVTLFLVIVLSLTLALPCFSAEAYTEKTVEYKSLETNTYKNYLNSNSQFAEAKENVTVQSITAVDNAELSCREFEGKTEVFVWENGSGRLDLTFEVENDGLYEMGFDYFLPSLSDNNFTFSMLLDGNTLFRESERFELRRAWENAGEKRVDGIGNEFAPEQQQRPMWQETRLSDSSGLYIRPFSFALTKGTHTVSFVAESVPIAFSNITLYAPQNSVSYEDYLKQNGKKSNFNGTPIEIQGEAANYKSANYLIAKSDRTSCEVYPSDAVNAKINFIGGSNWSGAGDTLSWKIIVPSDGYYALGYHYQQSYLMNGKSYRRLKIDGKVPFGEAEAIPFDYSYRWTTESFSDMSGSPYLIYLSKGEHLLTLETTLGNFSELAITLQELISEIGDLYREIIMITGENPDSNRDYNLFGQIPQFEERLKDCSERLEKAAQESEKISGEKGGSNASIMRNMANVMEMMLKYKYQAHNYQSTFYDNFSSISAWLYDTTNMPLDIDELYLYSPNGELKENKAGFFKKLVFSAKRLLSSFSTDYNNLSDTSATKENITLWVNWGRDQVQILNHLIQSDFTTEEKIGVNIKMTNASLVQAILSGNGPDCYLHLSRTQPINLAIRGAVYDLSQFEDYSEVIERFMPSASIPYSYNDGVYALPDTQTFYMLFYREDILAEYGLKAPKTWDEFIQVSAVLMRNNLQVGLPYTQITNMSQIDLGTGALNLFPTLLEQKGKTVYTEDLRGVDLLSEEAITAFTMLTDFYLEYSFPKSYDFYNRFRAGLMPMAVQNYTMYATLKNAASEIDGLWKMAPIPGVLKDDGSIDNSQIAGGTGAVIFKNSKNKTAAWKFLKWWTSADTQYSYSREVESVLGLVGRNSTATVEAASRLNWDSGVWAELEKQWQEVDEWPEIPGGYYIPRAVDQAFWNVLNGGKTPKEMLIKWNSLVNLEIEEKLSQYAE